MLHICFSCIPRSNNWQCTYTINKPYSLIASCQYLSILYWCIGDVEGESIPPYFLANVLQQIQPLTLLLFALMTAYNTVLNFPGPLNSCSCFLHLNTSTFKSTLSFKLACFTADEGWVCHCQVALHCTILTWCTYAIAAGVWTADYCAR